MSAVPKIGIGQSGASKPARTPKSEVLSIIDRMSLDPAISDERYKERIRLEQKFRDDAARDRARQSQICYDRAMTKMQPMLPTIAENGKVIGQDGKIRHTFAEWEDIAEECRPVLAEYGFNLTFRAAHASGRVLVKAICAHDDGWREETESLQFIDTSDGKNSNQAVKSAESYGKRAAATLLLNIISRGDDDDGVASIHSAEKENITEEQLQRILRALQTYGRSAIKLAPVLKVATLADLPASRFDEAIALIHQLGHMPILRQQDSK